MICATCLQPPRYPRRITGARAKKDPGAWEQPGLYFLESWLARARGTLRLRFDTKVTHATSPRSALTEDFSGSADSGSGRVSNIADRFASSGSLAILAAMQPCLQMAVVCAGRILQGAVHARPSSHPSPNAMATAV